MAVVVATVIADEMSSFKINTQRDDDRVEVTTDKSKTILSVHSPLGISSTVIERTGEKWPDVVVLCLHLKGLESFKLSNGSITLEAAVSSQDGTLRLWKDGEEGVPLDTKSSYWMAVRMIDSDGKLATKIPLKDGYFEMPLPRAFFEGNPKTITANWIDFYRG